MVCHSALCFLATGRADRSDEKIMFCLILRAVDSCSRCATNRTDETKVKPLTGADRSDRPVGQLVRPGYCLCQAEIFLTAIYKFATPVHGYKRQTSNVD